MRDFASKGACGGSAVSPHLGPEAQRLPERARPARLVFRRLVCDVVFSADVYWSNTDGVGTICNYDSLALSIHLPAYGPAEAVAALFPRLGCFRDSS